MKRQTNIKLVEIPCKHCGSLERYISNSYCPGCTKKHNQQYRIDNKDHLNRYRVYNKDNIKRNREQWYLDNKDHAKLYSQQYRKDNKDYVTQYDKHHNKQYYKANKDFVNQLNKKWQENNKDYVKQYCKKWREDNKDHVKHRNKRWCRLNPHKVAEYGERRLRHVRDSTPCWANQEMMKQIYLKRDELNENWNLNLQVDHIIPITSKTVCGLHCEANLQLMEQDINGSKSNNYQQDW